MHELSFFFPDFSLLKFHHTFQQGEKEKEGRRKREQGKCLPCWRHAVHAQAGRQGGFNPAQSNHPLLKRPKLTDIMAQNQRSHWVACYTRNWLVGLACYYHHCWVCIDWFGGQCQERSQMGPLWRWNSPGYGVGRQYNMQVIMNKKIL